MENKTRILLVDDEINMCKILQAALNREGYDVIIANSGHSALQTLESISFEMIITDLKMPGMDGMELLNHCTSRFPDIPVVMITAHGSIETAVEAMKHGAFDFISKPFEMDELKMVLLKAQATFIKNRQRVRKTTIDKDSHIIGESHQLKTILQMVQKVAGSPTTILISGESGTGKELIANMIHQLSPRRDKPFIKINCAAVPENLLESEFFGYEKGAFTGAVTNKPGRFELADNGTLFLDEIGEISKEMQVKLLRVLQEREFERVGGLKTIRVDVRLVVATNLDLAYAVQTNKFRQDLYYRLNVVNIHVPPLRDRPEDIPLLISHFIHYFNQKLNRNVTNISDTAMNKLKTYDWPGNIRELENTIERAILLAQSFQLTDADFSFIAAPPSPSGIDDRDVDFKTRIQSETEKLEKQLLENVLNEMGGNVTHAAKKLGISRKGLQLKMKRYGLQSGIKMQ